MNRLQIKFAAILLLLGICISSTVIANPGDRDRFSSDGMFIATTGRIVAVDLRNRTLRVRSSDSSGESEPTRSFAQVSSRIPMPVVTLPGGVSIHIPVRGQRIPPKTTAPAPDLAEYTVVITNKTVIQDGADSIPLEDFKEGEIISIHGVLSGSTLTASRVAKWS